jgi:hypothetical protein
MARNTGAAATDRLTNLETISDQWARLSYWLRYDPETGKIFWRRAPSTKLKEGTEAGWMVDGWRKIKLQGETYAASHLAWFLYYGCWPVKTIDHRNRKRWDNAIKNLREATRAQQMCNRGCRGVHKSRRNRSKPYVASICLHGQRKHLGYFASLQEAKNARRIAEIEMFGEFAREN